MRFSRTLGAALAVAFAGSILTSLPVIASGLDCRAPAGGYGVSIERAVLFHNRFGEKIAVDLHRPTGAPKGCRFPVVLESSAYRDWTTPGPIEAAATEDARRAWWVQRGYVFAFADVAGTGASEGEWCMFCEREQLSGVDMVNALGTQRWSNGNVGMIGGSYPAINAMLVAQHQPVHLKAVIAAQFSADLYDDFLYPGGMRRGEDALAIEAVFSYIDVLSGRSDMSFATMQDDHPTDDAWYAERRLRPEDVRVPVYAMGGWNDIFDRSVWRTFDRLGSKVKVLRQGPFTHVPVFPQANAWPCPSHDSDYCGAPLFDHFLKGIDTPAYHALVGNPVKVYVEPNGASVDKPYVEGPTKPATTPWRMTLGEPGTTAVVHADPTAGATGGRWFARGSVPGSQPPFDYLLGVDGPADQRVEETKVVSIASEPLADAVTIIGGGMLSLLASASAADADIAVRIIDEWPVGSAEHPEGYAYRLGGGWLRASHRKGNGAADLRPLVPGKPTLLHVDLWPIGYRFAKGHRIRIDIAGADVPRFAPPTALVDLTIDLGRSAVRLPSVSDE